MTNEPKNERGKNEEKSIRRKKKMQDDSKSYEIRLLEAKSFVQ